LNTILSDTINRRRLSSFGHLCCADTQSRQFSSSSGLHSGSSKDRRCRTGRPRQTWLRTVEDDLRPLNFGLAIATRSALNRSTIDMAAIQCICMIVSTWMLTCSEERGRSEEPVRFWLYICITIPYQSNDIVCSGYN